MRIPRWLQIRLIKSLIVLWIIIVLSLWWSTSILLAKDYSIQSVIIDAQLDTNGNMSITEKRTYDFKGHYSIVESSHSLYNFSNLRINPSFS